MKKAVAIVLRVAEWQNSNRAIISRSFAVATLIWFVAIILNRAAFISRGVDIFITLSLYLWFAAIVVWAALLVIPYFATYVRRREAGQGIEQAMLFEAKRPFTSSVWRDALVFSLIVLAGICFIGYFIYKMSTVGKR